MKKSILKNLMVLNFAVCALFVISNNVFADEPVKGDLNDDTVGITCHMDVERGRENGCYKLLTMGDYRWCEFTGYMADKCTL